ncbi:unnamed protein product, partial [Prorocentrum cordatum]
MRWHERAVLAFVRSGIWAIVAPDGHRHVESAHCRAGLFDPAVERPARLRGRFCRSKEGLSNSDSVDQIKMAEGEAYARTRKVRDPTSGVVLWGGARVEYVTAMDSEGAKLVPLVGGPVAAPSADAGRVLRMLEVDETRLSVDPFHPDFGDQRGPLPSAPAAGLRALAADASGRPVAVQRAMDFEVGCAPEAAGSCTGDGEAAGRAVRKDNGLEARLRQSLDGGAATPVSCEDSQTLSVNFDERGERLKALRDACAEVSYNHNADWERIGRTGTEMEMPADILSLSGAYDQVNGPSLARIEAASRRVRRAMK